MAHFPLRSANDASLLQVAATTSDRNKWCQRPMAYACSAQYEWYVYSVRLPFPSEEMQIEP